MILSYFLLGVIIKEMDTRDFSRFAFLPIRWQKLYNLYKKQRDLFWTPDEVDYTNDRSHWDRALPGVKQYVGFLVKLFAQLDGLVNQNLNENFKHETSEYAKECSNFYAIQEAVEVIHNETYSLLIKTFFRDPKEQEEGLNSIKYYPAIRKIADWCFEWMDPKHPLPERVIAFTCIEGIIFSSAFAGIYWVKRMNILPGLTKANEWIARDEAIHTEFGVALYHHLTGAELFNAFPRLDQERVHAIISSAVDATESFTKEAMNCDLVGLDAEDMVLYVKTTANALCRSLGYSPIYKASNPFDWMAIISLPNQSNFFETKVSEYAREGAEEADEELQSGMKELELDLGKPF